MAKRKPTRIRLTEEELIENGIKEDFFSDHRSENGYIKVTISPVGASLINQSLDDDIERMQRELEELKKQRNKLEDIEDSLSKKEKKKLKKKKKKEKKKKKKEKEKLKNLPESSKLLYNAIAEYQEKFYKKKKDKKKKKGEEFEGLVTVDKKKKSTNDEDAEAKAQRKKEEQEKKEFERRFEEPLALIRENLIDMTSTLEEINEMMKETKESRARNKHIIMKDLLTAKTALFNARASSAKSMADIQRARVDLELKKVKEQSNNMDEKTKNIALMNKFFPQLLASGKLSDLKKFDKDYDDDKKDKKKKKRKNKDAEENFERRVAGLIKDGNINLTPHELAISMEDKYKVIVMKSIKTGDWKFVATDLNGKIIKDFNDKYPGLLPKRKHVKLRFDDEKDIAKDMNTDTVYQVLHVPYI